jgi:hypothetical protein
LSPQIKPKKNQKTSNLEEMFGDLSNLPADGQFDLEHLPPFASDFNKELDKQVKLIR